MPVFRSGPGQAPPWCELEYFEIVELQKGDRHAFNPSGRKEKLILGQGACRIACGGCTVTLAEGAILDLEADAGPCRVVEVSAPATLIRMVGHWGSQTGGSGLFGVSRSNSPRNPGDPAGYARETSFDNHYHDCDEYWILFAGRGVSASEGRLYEVGPGDCVATGRGHHHDFPRVSERVRAVFFETTLEGQKRLGHLWEHTHGPAEPAQERV